MIALQEIGAFTRTDSPIAMSYTGFELAARLNALTMSNRHRYQYIELPPTHESTGGQKELNIRCAFLYNLDFIFYAIERLAENEPCFVGDTNQYSASRYPILLRGTYDSQPIAIINCHLKSMRSANKTLAKQAKKQRYAQASYLQDYVNTLLAQEPELALFIVGDFNDTPNSKTLSLLTQTQLQSIYTTKPLAFTHQHGNQRLIFDYILHTKLSTLSHYQIATFDPHTMISDHAAVNAAFTFD